MVQVPVSQWRVASGRWPVVSGQWSVVSGQIPVTPRDRSYRTYFRYVARPRARALVRPCTHALLLLTLLTALAAGCAAPPVPPPEVTYSPPLPAVRLPDPAVGPFDTPVTIHFRSATLLDAARQFSRATGLGVGVTRDATRATENVTVDLDIDNMPARHALDWLTRLFGACYVIEGPRDLFITCDRTWASQDRLQLRNYPLGALIRVARPVSARYNPSAETEDLLAVLRYALRHVIASRPDARIVLDGTGSRLSALLPSRGLAKLDAILAEMKKPRQYEPPASPADAEAALLATPVSASFPPQSVRDIVRELGLRADARIGIDLRQIEPQRRTVSLALGPTTLGKALEELARQTGLGRPAVEPGRRVWLLGKDQTPRLLRTTGELPWDRAVVRSYFTEPLVGQFGTKLIFDTIRKAVTPDEWDGDLPVMFYHRPTGRLFVIHDEPDQRVIARCVDQMMKAMEPQKNK